MSDKEQSEDFPGQNVNGTPDPKNNSNKNPNKSGRGMHSTKSNTSEASVSKHDPESKRNKTEKPANKSKSENSKSCKEPSKNTLQKNRNGSNTEYTFDFSTENSKDYDKFPFQFGPTLTPPEGSDMLFLFGKDLDELPDQFGSTPPDSEISSQPSTESTNEDTTIQESTPEKQVDPKPRRKVKAARSGKSRNHDKSKSSEEKPQRKQDEINSSKDLNRTPPVPNQRRNPKSRNKPNNLNSNKAPITEKVINQTLQSKKENQKGNSTTSKDTRNTSTPILIQLPTSDHSRRKNILNIQEQPKETQEEEKVTTSPHTPILSPEATPSVRSNFNLSNAITRRRTMSLPPLPESGQSLREKTKKKQGSRCRRLTQTEGIIKDNEDNRNNPDTPTPIELEEEANIEETGTSGKKSTSSKQVHNFSPVFDPIKRLCLFPSTFLTPRSAIPKYCEKQAFLALNKICKEISDSAQYKYNEERYKYNIVLLFYFFPIFLTPQSTKNPKEEVLNKLKAFVERDELPEINTALTRNVSPPTPPTLPRVDKTLSKKEGGKNSTKTNSSEETFHTFLPEKQVKKMVKFCREGRYQKALKCLTQGETADPTNPKTFDLFLNLHPQIECNYDKFKEDQNSPQQIENTIPNKMASMLEILTELIGKLKEDKAVGPTNWNNRAIKQCFKRCAYFPKALCQIALKMERGSFPFPDLLTDSFLIGLWKNPEHTSIRPIAIANNLSKFLITAAWKFCMKVRLNQDLPIQKNQFGIAVSCGAELPAFLTREYYRNKTLLQTISLDITNAFNSVNREKILDIVNTEVPALAPLVNLLYLHDSRLTLSSGKVILSKQGVRQGCPLSPFLFSLAIDKVLQKENEIAEKYGAQVVAYLDDHTFIQTNDNVKNREITLDMICNEIQPLLKDLNLELNKKKCYIFKPDYDINTEIEECLKPPSTRKRKRTKKKRIGQHEPNQRPSRSPYYSIES